MRRLKREYLEGLERIEVISAGGLLNSFNFSQSNEKYSSMIELM